MQVFPEYWYVINLKKLLFKIFFINVHPPKILDGTMQHFLKRLLRHYDISCLRTKAKTWPWAYAKVRGSRCSNYNWIARAKLTNHKPSHPPLPQGRNFDCVKEKLRSDTNAKRQFCNVTKQVLYSLTGSKSDCVFQLYHSVDLAHRFIYLNSLLRHFYSTTPGQIVKLSIKHNKLGNR